MKEYHYESVRYDHIFGAATEEHRGIIDRCAAEGWTYVGFLPTSITSHGVYERVDLIFVREC